MTDKRRGRPKRRPPKAGAPQPRAAKRASRSKPDAGAAPEQTQGQQEKTRKRTPVREPFVFGPRSHPTAIKPMGAAPHQAPEYDHGFPAPAPPDPWQDEGGESGQVP